MQSSNITILYLEPILDPYQNIYSNILTLSQIPKGPISKITRQIKVPKLSPFQTSTNCVYVLTNINPINSNSWMVEDDIPSVLSYLQLNNYKIETEHTEIMIRTNNTISQKRYSGNRKIICVFSYSENI